MEKRRKYNKTAEVYDARYKKVQFEKYKIMLAGLNLKGKILDHGCGTGLLGEFLDEKLYGVDFSENMLKMAKRKGMEVRQADLEKLPYKNDEFDFVLSFTSLQNVENPDQAIKEVKRVLKKNGKFICTFLHQFKDELKPILKKHFKIREEKSVGEDIGFILIL